MMPKLTDNVSINQTLPAHPNAALGIGAGDMQELLDRGVEIIKDYLNNDLTEAIDNLNANQIFSEELTADSGTTVSEQLSYILSQIQNATSGTIADGSITKQKLANDMRALVERDFALKIYSTPGTYTYTVPRSGKYLIILVGGGGAREGFKKYNSNDYYLSVAVPPTAGGVSIKLASLTKNDSYNVVIGAGGVGSGVPQSAYSGGATSGGTTSFGTLFSATGGARSHVEHTQACMLRLENTSVGTGVGGDINICSGIGRICAGRVRAIDESKEIIDAQEPSKNIFSSGMADSLTDASALFPGGAPRGAYSINSIGKDGANGAGGAAFILYLG